MGFQGKCRNSPRIQGRNFVISVIVVKLLLCCSRACFLVIVVVKFERKRRVLVKAVFEGERKRDFS